MIVMDQAFAFELERVEAQRQIAYVHALASLGVDTAMREIAGGVGVSCGTGFPINRGIALGVQEPLTDAHLKALEAFLMERNMPGMLELSSLAHASGLSVLEQRGYVPRGILNCYLLDLGTHQPQEIKLETRELGQNELHVWEDVSYRAWGDPRTENASRTLAKAAFQIPQSRTFCTVLNGVPVAVGAMLEFGRVATLFGGGTLPENRGCGAQTALLQTRLNVARQMGCSFVVSSAVAGSTSSRNMERAGFRLAHIRMRFEQVRSKQPE